MIRICMANPPYILNVYSFIHIPVSSNKVLDKMLREYNIEEFNFLCDKFIEGVPDITLATILFFSYQYS